MRPPIQSVARSVSHGFHAVAATPRVQRSFHQSTISALPRRRNFFTSSRLMAINHGGQDGQQSNVVTTAEQQQLQQPRVETSPAQRKSKASSAAAKTSKLRKNKATVRKPARAEITEDARDFSHTIKAVCVADSFNMEIVEEILKDQHYTIDPDDVELSHEEVIHARSHNQGDIFFFSDGTAVGWSVAAGNIVDLAQRHFLRAAANPHDEPEYETMLFSKDETSHMSYMKGEEAVLGTRSGGEGSKRDMTLAMIAFSKGLAKSAKLEYLDNHLSNNVLAKLKPSISALMLRHKIKPEMEFALRMTGELLNIRAELNYNWDLADPLPDIFWDEQPVLEDIVRQVGREFNTQQRIKQMNNNLDYGNELVMVLREMAQDHKGVRLEKIIIWLIAIEVGFGIYELSHDAHERYWDRFWAWYRGPEPETSH